jgi:hypothetical protein
MPYRVLDLSRCFLTDANVKAITEALAYSTKVQVLVLREARITEQVTVQATHIASLHAYLPTQHRVYSAAHSALACSICIYR